ncbi:MAG TPA: glycosyltransferase family 4 protein [Vicinamibacteria bacterium]
MKQLAFVVQRYGEDVTGGSESLARALAERLDDYEVTVFATCARDYVTWRNELPAGAADLRGVRVLRFPVAEERDLAAFNRFSDALYDQPHGDEAEAAWLRQQGPYVPELVEALRRRQGEFVAVVFFTYLYYPTCAGLEAAPARSILVPTAHDEPPLRLRLYERVFALPRAFAFLTRPEEALVRSRFALGERPARLAGMGVEVPPHPDVAAFRARHGVVGPYLLYAGRIDAGKGCEEMVAHYARWRREAAGEAPLLLIGKLAMPEPQVPGVRYLGYLEEAEKAAAVAGASVVVCPSPYESLSISLLEGFAYGVPGLVSARSEVLLDHCRRAGGGLYYADGDEFGECLSLLLADGDLRRALGEGGRRYVAAEYRWEVVLGRYRELIAALG